MRYIYADDFRVEGEKTILFATIAVACVLFFFLLGISLGLIIFLVVLSAAWVKVRQGQLLGQSIKVTENQLPEVHNVAKVASERLYIDLPDIFVTQNPIINAYAIGFLGKKSIVLNSATVESMKPNELLAVIGHELTHIKAGHTDWIVITGSTESIQVPIISQIMRFIFFFWTRKAEYTSDRGALLACRDPRAVVNSLAKVAVGEKLFEKLNLENLFNQKMNIDEDGISKLSESLSTHPYIINRIHEITKFYASEKYAQLTKNN